MIIGSGSHQYDVIDLWGKLPEGKKFGTTHGVVEDAAGRIYIHHTGAESTYIFEPDGTFISAWGAAYTGNAHGMFLNKEADGEFLYLAPTGMGILAKCTLDGEEIMRLGTPPRPDIYTTDKRYVPTESTVASNGDIYVTDGYGQHWVHRYTKDGEYVSSFGNPGGTGDGELRNPHGIMIDTRSGSELILVADRANNRLQYFTLEGEYVKQVHHDLRLPCTTVQWRDEIYVPDLQSRLSVFDKDDKLILHLGDRPDCWTKEGWPNIPREDWVVGAFSSPHDMHVDAAGNIYVAEWLSNGTGKCTKLVRKS